MSKTFEMLSEQQQSKQQKKQELMTTVASPPAAPETPEDLLAELLRFREAAARNSRPSFFGKILRFRKGDWVLGQEKEKIPDRSRWIAIMGEARHGWIKWTTETAEDGSTKKVPVHVVGKIIEGYEPPPLDELGDRDQSQWKLGLNGKPEDPYKPFVYLPLLSLDGEKVVTFTTSTNTGLPRFWKLIDKYQWIGQRHLGQYPVIELRAGGYDDRKYGWILRDHRLGWSAGPGAAAESRR